jgi:glycosyltransferase involved in cell wall biosynthesis
MSNVYFLGGKAHTDLPYYVNAMDINLLCYTIDKNSWSYFGYPLKLHECLATGKPVISAPLHAVLEYDEVVKIADTFEDWELAISHALDGKSAGVPESRVKVAEANSWDVRVQNLQEKLREKSIT